MKTLRERAADAAAKIERERAEDEARRHMERADAGRFAIVHELNRRLNVVGVEAHAIFFDPQHGDDPFVFVEGILFSRHVNGDYGDLLLVAWRCPTCTNITVNYGDDVRDLSHLDLALQWRDELEQDPSRCPQCRDLASERLEEAVPAPKPRKPTTEERLAQAIGEIVDAHIDAHVSAYHAEEA